MSYIITKNKIGEVDDLEITAWEFPDTSTMSNFKEHAKPLLDQSKSTIDQANTQTKNLVTKLTTSGNRINEFEKKIKQLENEN